jgi:hypothetical protein
VNSTKVAALLLLVAVLLGGCSGRAGVQIPIPLSFDEIEPAAPVDPIPAQEYECPPDTECYPLAFVGVDGVLRVAFPWYAVPTDLMEARPGQAVSWLLVYNGEVDEPFVTYVSRQGSVNMIQPQTRELREPGIPAEPDESAIWLSDYSVAVYRTDQGGMGLLKIASLASGLIKLEVQFYGQWAYRPSGRYAALGVPARGKDGAVRGSDLGLLDAADGTIRTLARAQANEFFMPIGWLDADVLAYRDAKFPSEAKYVNVNSGAEPVPQPKLPLYLDFARVAGLVPSNLRATWSGTYCMSPGGDKLAVETKNQDGSPAIYVGHLSSGKWYFVGLGSGPAWGPLDASSEQPCCGSP